MPERSHLSIGEVLSLLREEFPDVTISKIRFLESQGLVDPERTPSGYRKFYEPDVERLRWILRQQREHFLPLKVIRGRLSQQEAEAPNGPSLVAQSELPETEAPVPARAGVGASMAEAPALRRPAAANRPAPNRPSLFAGLHPEPEGDRGAPPPAASPAPVTEAGERAEADLGTQPPGRSAPRTERRPEPTGGETQSTQSTVDEPETFTAEELAAATGATPNLVNDLKQYGFISPHAIVAGTAYFDESALAIARCAAEFSRHGVEPRHLRIWRNAADREADLFQQIVLPLLRQRNPQARRQATETLAELAQAGRDLRTALLDRALRDIR